jgi:hypothetical protein
MTHITYGMLTRQLKPDHPITINLNPDDTAWTPTGTIHGPTVVTYTRNRDHTGTVTATLETHQR